MWPHVSPNERERVERGVGGGTQQQWTDGAWRIESLQVMMWVLELIGELPAYDVRASKELFKQLKEINGPLLLSTGHLRGAGEISKARDIAELWHWRSRTRQLIERGEIFRSSEKTRAAGIRTFDDIVRIAARKAAAEGIFPECVDEDFPAKGKAYRDLTDGEWAEVRSITVERHFALNWLCGRAPGNRWDETPTGT